MIATSLRIAVFGIPRSGKDYSIAKVKEAMNALDIDFVHYPGVPTVRNYSLPVLGKEFKDTTIEEKGTLMDVFRKKISDRERFPFLIQDEHYCFPTTYGGKPLINEYTKSKFPFDFRKDPGDLREYEIVLKEEWIASCDVAFYLHSDPDVILERMHNSEGPKRNAQITSEDIDLWMRFETDSLREICSAHHLRFEVFDENDGAYEGIIRCILELMGAEPGPPPLRSPADRSKV